MRCCSAPVSAVRPVHKSVNASADDVQETLIAAQRLHAACDVA
jgi:hypothetical protein